MAWVTATGYNDPNDKWIWETNAYDGNTGTYALTEPPVEPSAWSYPLELTIGAMNCSKIRYYAYNYSTPRLIRIKVYYSGAWHQIYYGSYAVSTWNEVSLGGIYSVTKMSIDIYNYGPTKNNIRIHEAQFLAPTLLTSTTNITTSIASVLSRGITEALTSTITIATSTSAVLSRGVTETLSATVNIVTFITSTLSKGITEVLTSTANIATSITSASLRTKTKLTSTINIVTSITGKLLKDYISLTRADRTYTGTTRADKTFTPVSDVTPDGTVEEKFKWNYIVPIYDTWLELLAKEHWCDWNFGTAFVDAWSSLITPTKTYASVTTPDKTYKEVNKYKIDV